MTQACPHNDPDVERFRVLLETARHLGRAMDLPSLVREILAKAECVMNTGACSLFLPDEQSGELILVTTDTEWTSLDRARRIPNDQGIAGEVFHSLKPVNVADAHTDPRHYGELDKGSDFRTRALLTVPLPNGGECLGVLQALNPKDRPSFDDRDLEIFEGFAALIVSALLRIRDQDRALAETRSREEMRLAREIQSSFLPSGFQTGHSHRVALQYYPARILSGDFYLVEPLAGKRVMVCVGDVSGKGIPAALNMARATARITAHLETFQPPLADWLQRVNRSLCRDLRGGNFIGATFLLCDPEAGSASVCAAGQNPPLLREDGRWTAVQAPPNLALGILPDTRFRTVDLPLRAGSLWLLVSDGFTEARNAAGEELGWEGFREALPEALDAEGTAAAAAESWRRFTGSASQHDDATLVALDWITLLPPARFNLDCRPEKLAEARRFIDDWCRSAGFTDITAGCIVLAVDEAVTNIYRHAYRGRPGPVLLQVGLDSKKLRIALEDEAGPVNPASFRGRDLQDVRPGGLGTVILNRVFDSVRYEPSPSGTRLLLEKAVPKHPRDAPEPKAP